MRIYKLIILTVTSLLAGLAVAQPSFNQPYSIEGAGLFIPQGTSAQAGTAYTGTAISNPLFLNTINPALLARTRSAHFDYSMNWDFNRVTSADESGSSYSPSLNYINFTFPVSQRVSSGLSFNRYTNSNYSFTTTSDVGTIQNKQSYDGEGGISEFRWATGAEIIKDTAASLSVYLGANASILFGNTKRLSSSQLIEDGVEASLIQQFVDRTSYSGSHFKPGFAIRKEFRENYFFGYPTQDSLAEDCYDGKYFILIPNYKFSVPSNKIANRSEANRLKRIYDEFRGDFFGVLIKENAVNVHKDTLRKDFIATYKAHKALEAQNKPHFKEFTGYMKRKKGLFWNFGGYYELGSTVNTSASSISNQVRSFDQSLVSSDTTFDGQESEIALPQTIGIGIGLDKPGLKTPSWSLGLDMSYTNWSSSQLIQASDKQSSWALSCGFETTPDRTNESQKSKDAAHPYWRRVTYRTGAFYNTSPYVINGSQVNAFGINFGLSLPIGTITDGIKNGNKYMNVALSLGQRGSISANKLQEQFVQLGLSFSVNEKGWFKPRKLGL